MPRVIIKLSWWSGFIVAEHKLTYIFVRLNCSVCQRWRKYKLTTLFFLPHTTDVNRSRTQRSLIDQSMVTWWKDRSRIIQDNQVTYHQFLFFLFWQGKWRLTCTFTCTFMDVKAYCDTLQHKMSCSEWHQQLKKPCQVVSAGWRCVMKKTRLATVSCFTSPTSTNTVQVF